MCELFVAAKFILAVVGACWLSWKAICIIRGGCVINCDEEEAEANAMTLPPAPRIPRKR